MCWDKQGLEDRKVHTQNAQRAPSACSEQSRHRPCQLDADWGSISKGPRVVYTEWCGDIERSAVHKRRAHLRGGDVGAPVEGITKTTIEDCGLDPTGKESYTPGCVKEKPAEASQATFVATEQAATRDS